MEKMEKNVEESSSLQRSISSGRFASRIWYSPFQDYSKVQSSPYKIDGNLAGFTSTAKRVKSPSRMEISKKSSVSLTTSKDRIREEEEEDEIDKVLREAEEETQKRKAEQTKLLEENRKREIERRKKQLEEIRKAKLKKKSHQKMIEKLEEDQKEVDSNEKLLWSSLLAGFQKEKIPKNLSSLTSVSTPPFEIPSTPKKHRHHHHHHRNHQLKDAEEPRIKTPEIVSKKEFTITKEKEVVLKNKGEMYLRKTKEKYTENTEELRFGKKEVSTEVSEEFEDEELKGRKKKIMELEMMTELKVDFNPDSVPVKIADYFQKNPNNFNVTMLQERIEMSPESLW